jgi:beta-phosphoglucomutase-like phosphatase (HAD superfamily)/dTDP-glucose pyrophosphorylase
MNKLVIFDLDGVLIESRELHFKSLNTALRKINVSYEITRDEHLSIYDGLSTTRKLELLNENKGLDKKHFNQIWNDKQQDTCNLIKQFEERTDLHKIFFMLKIGVMEYVDYFISNEDVQRSKPFPEMYWKCMTALNAIPKNTVIFEDSHIGRKAALDSGAHLIPINNTEDLTVQKINDAVEILTQNNIARVPWKDKKLNVLIPMAGAGTRFSQQGYTFPKPLIEVNGKPMIEVVVDNLNIDAHFIFLVQKEHYEQYNLKYLLNLIAPGCDIVQTDGVTQGAACSTLLAKELINNTNPLIIANSDQFIEWNSNECMYSFSADEIDAGILTFNSHHPKWSYVKLNDSGFVSDVAEKKVISDNATVGVYYWKHGKDYVKYAEQMIDKNIRVNNEFYVCPVFNEAIIDNKKIKIKKIDRMWGLGTPEDLTYFINNYKK